MAEVRRGHQVAVEAAVAEVGFSTGNFCDVRRADVRRQCRRAPTRRGPSTPVAARPESYFEALLAFIPSEEAIHRQRCPDRIGSASGPKQ